MKREVLQISISVLIFFVLLACYSTPFSLQNQRSAAQKNTTYYAVQVRFSPDLLVFFERRGCNYDSNISWKLYFSRDPNSYTPYNTRYIPMRSMLWQNSDLELFLPPLVQALDAYQKKDFFLQYPMITAAQDRNYKLSTKEILEIQKARRSMFSNTGNTLLPRSFENLPIQITEEGLIPQNTEKPPYSAVFSSGLQFNTPLQRSQEGPYFLNYMRMLGQTKGETSAFELWNLPVVLPHSSSRYQYLGELEIGLAKKGEGGGTRIRYNNLGQINLQFRINDRLDEWQGYLGTYLSSSRFRRPSLVYRGGLRRPVQPRFERNLLQNVAKDYPWRAYPFSFLVFGSQAGCYF